MLINPYLIFNGNAEEALEYYRSALGGDVQLMRYESSPEAGDVAPDWKTKVMHGSLRSPVGEIMASDATPERWAEITQGTNISLSLTTEVESEADFAFTQLAKKGTVTMPFENTFWGAKFGIVTDPFGIKWMINCQLKVPA